MLLYRIVPFLERRRTAVQYEPVVQWVGLGRVAKLEHKTSIKLPTRPHTASVDRVCNQTYPRYSSYRCASNNQDAP